VQDDNRDRQRLEAGERKLGGLVKADFSDVLREVNPLTLKDSWDNEQRGRIPRGLHPTAQEKAE
jgi:hypothetical protein